jgi:hypothetical protein
MNKKTLPPHCICRISTSEWKWFACATVDTVDMDNCSGSDWMEWLKNIKEKIGSLVDDRCDGVMTLVFGIIVFCH